MAYLSDGACPDQLSAIEIVFPRRFAPQELYSPKSCSASGARLCESRNLVHCDFVGDAAQGAALRYRLEPAGFEQGGSLRVGYDGASRQDRARICETLDPRGDVHGRPEIILAVVEHDSEARSFVDADLQQQILAVM